jgi:hypothetical protein
MPWKDIEKRRAYDRRRNATTKRKHYDTHRPNQIVRNQKKAERERLWRDENKETYLPMNKVRRRKQRKLLRAYVLDYFKTHPCVDCGEQDPDVLTFDHVRGKKKYNVSQLVIYGYSFNTLIAEIAKCDVRCFNHHMKRTRRDQWGHKANQ